MTDKKPFWKSGTLWGILIFLAPTISNILGYDLVPVFQDSVITGDEIVQLAGAMWAAYSRVKATHELTVKPVEEPYRKPNDH